MLTKKRGAVAAVVAIVLLGVGVPTAAYADDDETDQLVISFPVDEAFEEELGTATAQNTSTGEMITPFYDPPLGGCDWSDTSGTITANYLSGVLSDLTANYQGKTTCLTTAAGQSMEHMSTVVNLYKNNTNMDSGNVDDCNYNTVNSCTLVLSVGIHNCIGDLLCEGIYQVGQFPTMTLPDGWTWTSWPSSCTNLGTDTLACYSYSGTMVIPLVYPG
ncbi:hypothetical protein [Microbacterium lacticum]